MSRKAGALAVTMAAALVVLPAAPARAVVAAAIPGSSASGYATPTVVAPTGGPVFFNNTDSALHDITAFGVYVPKRLAKAQPWCAVYTRSNCPLFMTEPIGFGETTEVQGLDLVKSGKEYPFYCSLHTGMRGTLVVP